MTKRTYDPDQHCGGKTRAGTPCVQPKGHKTEHAGLGRCALHGGATPSHVAKAQRDAAVKLARTLGEPVEGDPEEFLMLALAWRQGQVIWWRERVQALDPDALTAGVRGVSKTVSDASGGPMAGHMKSKTTDAGPHLHLALQEYKAAQTALEWLSLQLVKTELGRRMVKLAEAQQAMLADGFRWLVVERWCDYEQKYQTSDIEGNVGCKITHMTACAMQYLAVVLLLFYDDYKTRRDIHQYVTHLPYILVRGHSLLNACTMEMKYA